MGGGPPPFLKNRDPGKRVPGRTVRGSDRQGEKAHKVQKRGGTWKKGNAEGLKGRGCLKVQRTVGRGAELPLSVLWGGARGEKHQLNHGGDASWKATEV